MDSLTRSHTAQPQKSAFRAKRKWGRGQNRPTRSKMTQTVTHERRRHEIREGKIARISTELIVSTAHSRPHAHRSDAASRATRTRN